MKIQRYYEYYRNGNLVKGSDKWNERFIKGATMEVSGMEFKCLGACVFAGIANLNAKIEHKCYRDEEELESWENSLYHLNRIMEDWDREEPEEEPEEETTGANNVINFRKEIEFRK